MALFSRYLTTLEVAVNAFYNHHQDNSERNRLATQISCLSS